MERALSFTAACHDKVANTTYPSLTPAPCLTLTGFAIQLTSDLVRQEGQRAVRRSVPNLSVPALFNLGWNYIPLAGVKGWPDRQR